MFARVEYIDNSCLMRVLEGGDLSHIALEPQVFIMKTSLLEKSVQLHG